MAEPDERGLPAIFGFVAELADFEGRIEDEAGALEITGLSLDLPVELDLEVAGDETVRILAGPPTQQIETGVMPVFHRVRLRVERHEEPRSPGETLSETTLTRETP